MCIGSDGVKTRHLQLCDHMRESRVEERGDNENLCTVRCSQLLQPDYRPALLLSTLSCTSHCCCCPESSDSLVHSLNHSFDHSSIHLFTHFSLTVYSFAYSFTCLLTFHSVYSFTYSFTSLHSHSLVSSFICSLKLIVRMNKCV